MGIPAVFDIPFFKYSKTILRGKNIDLRAPRRWDQRQWMDVRRVSKEFLQPWEPTWPADGVEKTAFRRRLRRFTADWNSGASYPFFIINRKTNDLLGGITLSNLRRGVTQTATVGYWIGLPYARCGHMAEAVSLLLDYAFDDLRLHRVEAACLMHNEPSRKLLLKLGFTEEGVARQYLCIDGRWQDHRTFGILQADRRAKS
jgi:ribosomal-protein-alanine N-acetyltransferase